MKGGRLVPTPTTTSVKQNGRVAALPSQPELRIEVITVTPDMAANWLARGGKNRTLNARRVNALAAAIHRGEWRLTGEAIKIDADGQVRDGQHRLGAIVKAGIGVETVVVRNVDEAAFDVMDTGKARSIADVLSIHGFSSTAALSATARLLIFYERFGEFYSRRAVVDSIISSPSVLNYLSEHDDVVNAVRMAYRVRTAGLQGGMASWAAVFTLCLRISAEQAYQFEHMLVTGEELESGHPVLVLRNRMLFRRKDMSKILPQKRQETAALAIKGWNAWRKGTKVQMLVWKENEAFPRPA